MRASSALPREFVQAGFTLVRHNKHAIWRCPCGHATITTSRTPGKGRAMWNAQAQKDRILRVCNQRLERCT